jgi:hypothetical protein
MLYVLQEAFGISSRFPASTYPPTIKRKDPPTSFFDFRCLEIGKNAQEAPPSLLWIASLLSLSSSSSDRRNPKTELLRNLSITSIDVTAASFSVNKGENFIDGLMMCSALCHSLKAWSCVKTKALGQGIELH